MSILDFKSNLLGGGARPNQFKVELTFPSFVSGGSDAGRKAQFLCTAASLPGSYLGVASVFYRGREVKLPGERNFDNWRIQIVNDTDFSVHDAFETWQNYINDVKNNSGITNPNMITAQMAVHQLDRNGATLKSYNFVDCWPVNVSDIQLNFGANNQVEEFSVELAYAYWETKKSSTSIGGNIGINTPFGGFGVGI
jgi:hypothetical protein